MPFTARQRSTALMHKGASAMNDSIPTTRICKKCGIEKPATLEYFSHEKRVKDGCAAQCRECQKQYQITRYKNDSGYREYLRAKKKERHNNPVKLAHDKERNRENAKRPEVKRHRAEQEKKRMLNPLYKRNKYNKRNESRRKRYANDPEYHNHTLELCAKSFAKPERKAKIRLYKHDRYANDPEYRRKHREIILRRAKTKEGKMRAAVAGSKRRAAKRNAEGFHTSDDVDLQYRSQKGKCWHCGKDLNGKYEVDHLVPLDKGGTNWPNNIVCSCRKCNRSKGAKLLFEWNGRLF